jgi:hypothetical protein
MFMPMSSTGEPSFVLTSFPPEALTPKLPVGTEETVEFVLATVAEQDAVLPPFVPVQLQLHGPEPLTLPAVPAEQRFVVGAVVKLTFTDEPQEPLTAVVVVVEPLGSLEGIHPPFHDHQFLLLFSW